MTRISAFLAGLILFFGCGGTPAPTTSVAQVPGIPVTYHPADAFYSVDFVVDGQSITNVLLDTGSSNFLVFGDAQLCPTCLTQSDFQDFTPSTYTPANAPLENGSKFSVTYGTASASAQFYNAQVGIASQTAFTYPIGVIASGSSISNIVGLGYPRNLVGFSDLTPLPYLDAYVVKNNLSNLFTLNLCPSSETGGFLSIGSVPTEVTSPIKYTAIIADSLLVSPAFDLYNVAPIALWVAGENAPLDQFPAQSSNYLSIVDSGTPLIYVPDTMLTAISNYYASAGIPSAFWDLLDPNSVAINAEQYSHLKDFEVELPNASGGSFKVTVTPKTYTFNVGTAQTPSYISGFGKSLSLGSSSVKLVILGDVFMQNVVSVFDRDAQKLGFASNTSLCH